jgi:SWI/SNF-related matrix-associated actin-dependent regulator 1 of chromatin subfamily A
MIEKDRLVVFTYHLDVSDELKEALTCGDFKVHQITGRTPMHVRDQIVTEFQDTTTESKQVLLAQIEAAGVGINLHAADTGLFFELDWVPARMAQAIDRLHRLGQESTVQIIYLVAHNTLDTQIIDSLREKVEAIQEVMK